MTWKEKVVIRILMLIAKHFSEGDLKKEIESLATHILYSAPDIK